MLNYSILRSRFSAFLAHEFQPAGLPASLLSTVLIYSVQIILAISFAALIFSGGLSSQMSQGVSFIILGNAVMLILISLISSYPGSIGTAQNTPAAVLGLVAASIAAAPNLGPAQQFATVLVMTVCAAVVTGVFFLLLGFFKLGGLMRFLPYPVMGGFLAGSGWLLIKGGLGIMAGLAYGPGWLEPQSMLHWVPGVLLGVLIFQVASRYQESIALPVVLGLAVVVFYIAANLLHVSTAQLESQGWVVGAIPSDSLSRLPLSPAILSQVDWRVLFSQLPNLAPVAVISIIALLLNCGGLELVLKTDMDLNRELLAAGAGNLFSGLIGGPVGYQAISMTTLNFRITKGKRLPGLLAALLVALTVFLGTAFLMYIPKLVVGAVLVYLGLGLLVEWVYRAWFKFPRIDFVIILTILSVILFSDFLNGIILGLVLAIILFVVSYSQVSVVKFEMMGREYRSRMVRSPSLQRLLQQHGDQLYIMRLQGFIFFGTANGIFNQIRDQLQNTKGTAVRYFLLDFNHVSGLDSTGLFSFTRLLQMAEERKITVVLTGLRGRALEQFERGGFVETPGGSLRFFADMDHGIEWCEDAIIANVAGSQDQQAGNLVAELSGVMGQPALVTRLVSLMQRCEFQAGDYLVRQGDEPEMIYFIESGQVSVQVEIDGREPARLETTHGGRPVGELGFYLNTRRTAAVVADTPCVAYAFSTAQLEALEKSEPAAANLFHRIVLHFLGQRLIQTTATVVALER